MNLATGKDAAKALLLAGKAAPLRGEQKRLKDAKREPRTTPSFIKTPSQMDPALRRKIANGIKVSSGMGFEASRRRNSRTKQPAGHPATKARVQRSRVPRLSA